MRKYLIFCLVLFSVALLGISFSIATDEKPLPKPHSMKAVQNALDDNANMDLKAELAPVHTLPDPSGLVGPYEPTQEELDIKDEENQNQILPLTTLKYTQDLKRNPRNTGAAEQPLYDPRVDLFMEGFEGGIVPPTGWTTVVNNSFTWEIDNTSPFEGSYNASCFYDENYTGTQDEWLITPSIDLTTDGTDWVLTFAWMGSYYWSIDPYNNYDLEVWISTDGGTTFSTKIWDESMFGVFDNWVWYQINVPLTAYTSYSDVKIGFRYYGYDGAQFSIDAISVNDAAVPTGRCCFGNPAAPDCEDGITEADCDALEGSWAQGLNCTDNPCPLAPDNDTWQYAEQINGPFPTAVDGTTEAATIDCPGVLDWNAVWYVFEAPYALNDINLSYCGTVPGLEEVGIVLYEDPVVCENYIIADGSAWTDCGDGQENPVMDWTKLPGPAVYYLPVFTGNDKVQQPFQFTIDVIETPPPETGDYCGDPIVLNVGTGDFPFTITDQYTCGRGNWYESSCLGYYDGGEDIIYQLNLADDAELKIIVDSKETTYVGVMVSADCPDDDGTCIAYATSSGGSPIIGSVSLTAGTYYVMVDTWPAPDCIPDFDITFEVPVITSGDNCDDPLIVTLPADMDGNTYVDAGQTTCGRIDDYNATCLGSYDGGEDIIYQFDVTEEMTVDITVDASVSWVGMSISTLCPDDGSSCLATSTGSSGSQGIYSLTLAAGTYYVMVDTWPSPNCIPSFDLTVTAAEGCTTNDCWELCESVSDVFEMPFTTIGTTPDGPQGCLNSPNIWYCYTATCTGPARVSLCGSEYDTKMAVYDGVDPFTANLIGCNDDFCGLQSEITFDAAEGTIYLIELGGYGSNTGDGIMTIECVVCDPPPNDNCEDVTPVTLTLGTQVTFNGDNTCATHQCDFFDDGHVWEAFILETDADVTLDYCGTSPAFGNAWLNLSIGCPCTDFTVAGVWNTDDCGDGNVSIYHEGLAPGTYYYPVLLDPANGAEGPYTINVLATAITEVCDASGGCDEYISRVVVGTIDNSSACDGYADYTAMSTDVDPAGSYPISIENGNGYYNDICAVWVDWNNNFVFNVDEEVILDVSSGYGPYTGNIAVPSGASGGDKVMRVRIAYSSMPGPCGTTSYGEVEDYTLHVAGDGLVMMQFVPDTVSVIFKFSIDPMEANIYVSEMLMEHPMADIDMGSFTMTLTNSGNTVPVTSVLMPSYPGMPGEILNVSFDMADYIVAEENGVLLFDYVESFFDIYYEIDIEGVPTGQNITGSVPVRGHVSGDLNLSGVVDISDITFFVEWMFAGGDVPQIIELADTNADGSVSITDLTWIVNYMFNDGPKPMHNQIIRG